MKGVLEAMRSSFNNQSWVRSIPTLTILFVISKLKNIVTYQPKEHVAPSEKVFWNFPKVDLVVVCWFRTG